MPLGVACGGGFTGQTVRVTATLVTSPESLVILVSSRHMAYFAAKLKNVVDTSVNSSCASFVGYVPLQDCKDQTTNIQKTVCTAAVSGLKPGVT